MLVIFREAEVAFLPARVLAFGLGLRPVALLVLPFGRTWDGGGGGINVVWSEGGRKAGEDTDCRPTIN